MTDGDGGVSSTNLLRPSTTNNIFVLKPSEAGNVLLRALQRFYAEKKLFDVDISCNGRTLFGCHKLVLASCSSYFETLLTDTDGFAILNLDAVHPDYVRHLKSIVDFMYGHNLNVSTHDCDQLYEAARIFGVTALIKTLDVQYFSTTSTNSNSIGQNSGGNSSVILQPRGIGPMLLISFQGFKFNDKFIDAKICCRDRVLFTCHKVVLASFSAYFESLLSSTEGSAILNLDAVDSLYVDQLSTIIDYMYGNTTYLREEQVDLLRDAATVFGVHALEAGDLEKMRQVRQRNRAKKQLTEKLDKLRNHGATADESVSSRNNSKRIGGKRTGEDSGGSIGNAGTSTTISVAGRKPTSGRAGCSSTPIDFVTEEVISEGCWANPSVTIDAPPIVQSPSAFFQSPSATQNEPRSHSTGQSPITSKDAAKIADMAETVSNLGLVGTHVLCSHCGRVFRRNTMGLRSHLLRHQLWDADRARIKDSTIDADRAIKCAECPQIIADGLYYSTPLRQHWESIHGDQQSERGCFECESVFVDKTALRQHRILAHGLARETAKSSSAGIDRPSNIGQGRGSSSSSKTAAARTKSARKQTLPKKSKGAGISTKLTCRACGFTSTILPTFMEHVDREHGNNNDSSCHACDQSFADRQSLKLHYHQRHNMALYLCKICGKVFKTSNGFRVHKETHGQQRRCAACGFLTTTKRNLELHTKKYHPTTIDSGSSPATTTAAPPESSSTSASSTTDPLLMDNSAFPHLPHKCPDCSAAFLFESLLTRHYHRVHLKLRPYKCTHCGYSTSEKAALQTHIRCVHTDEAIYACPVCKIRFKTYSILKRHQRVHTGERPHQCDKCDASFAEKRDLTAHCWKEHEKVHPFKCPLCRSGFFRKDNLLQHQRTKHGDQPIVL